MSNRDEVLNQLAELSQQVHRQGMRRRAIFMLAGALLLTIGGLVITAINFNALGFVVSDFQATLIRGIGFLTHIAGFFGLVNFIFSDEREYLFPRKKGAKNQ